MKIRSSVYGPLAWFLVTSAMALPAVASVTLIEKDDWKILMGGFAQMDMLHDSTRSLNEVAGNNPVDRGGSFAGDNGKTQFSVRNSRLNFTLFPPVQNEMKTKGLLEFDLLGYEPNIGPGARSEADFFSAPTMRLRHAYFSTERNGWTMLVGQTWSLFGWQPYYVTATATVPPGPGSVFQRTPQLTFIKAMEYGEGNKFQAGLSLTRPSQRDSEIPNLDGGLRMSWGGLRSGLAAYNSDQTSEPLSVALSGTYRQFQTPQTLSDTSTQTHYTGYGVVFDTLVPILSSSDGKDIGNTLTFTGEYSTGQGYGDQFPGWSGNLAHMPVAATPPTDLTNVTNIDAGIGGFDAAGTFQLVKLQSWNAELQYHFAGDTGMFTTVGYAELSSSNVGGLKPATKTNYDRSSMYFANLFHDFSKQIRVGAEYSYFTTHYTNDANGTDRRIQVSSLFRF